MAHIVYFPSKTSTLSRSTGGSFCLVLLLLLLILINTYSSYRFIRLLKTGHCQNFGVVLHLNQ